MTVRQRRSGHTLVELLYAIFLVGCCAAVLATGMPTAKASQTRADMENKATSVAQKQLEAVKAAGYPNLSGPQLHLLGLLDSSSEEDGKFWFCEVARSDNEAESEDERRFLQDMECTLDIVQTDLDLRTVTIEVSWRDGGERRSVELASHIANL